MTNDEIRAIVLQTIATIAPEVADETLAPARPLRDQVDLDSMDWLNVLVGLHQRLGIDIPEADYRRLVTLDDIVAYVAAKIPPG